MADIAGGIPARDLALKHSHLSLLSLVGQRLWQGIIDTGGQIQNKQCFLSLVYTPPQNALNGAFSVNFTLIFTSFCASASPMYHLRCSINPLPVYSILGLICLIYPNVSDLL